MINYTTIALIPKKCHYNYLQIKTFSHNNITLYKLEKKSIY